MIDLKSPSIENIDSKPPTPSVIMISNKDTSIKYDDLMTFQKNGIS